MKVIYFILFYFKLVFLWFSCMEMKHCLLTFLLIRVNGNWITELVIAETSLQEFFFFSLNPNFTCDF